jgi:hypothetical protein
MKTKLTLTIEQRVVKNAKKYARKQGRSLSDLVENYLKAITDQEEQETVDVSPLVRSMQGGFRVPDDFDYDYKKGLKDGLSDNYL